MRIACDHGGEKIGKVIDSARCASADAEIGTNEHPNLELVTLADRNRRSCRSGWSLLPARGHTDAGASRLDNWSPRGSMVRMPHT